MDKVKNSIILSDGFRVFDDGILRRIFGPKRDCQEVG
jgi:hypothetical protein